MDPSRDWIKLHRNLLVNDLWRSEPFSKGQAWVDLLLLANHTDGFFFNRGIKVEVKRGQVGMSELQLSIRWKWSRTKVRSFFGLLEKEQQIVQQKNNVNSLITIVNYDMYQQKKQEEEQQEDSRKTPKEQQKDTNKNEKNDKNEKNKPLQTSEVRALYMKYAGLVQCGNGQVVVFKEIAETFTRETVIEAFTAAAGKNIPTVNFLNWSHKRMQRINEPQPSQSDAKALSEAEATKAYYRSLGHNV